MTDPQDQIRRTINARLGTVLLLLAGALSVLIFLDQATSLAVGFPGIWYRTRGMHLMLCIGLYLLAWLALRKTSDPPDDPRRQPAFRSVRLYTRQDCELCDRAAAILARFKQRLPPIEVIDIDDHPRLLEQHGQWIPVVEIDGEVRFRGSVSEVLLQRLIEAQERSRQPASSDDEDEFE